MRRMSRVCTALNNERNKSVSLAARAISAYRRAARLIIEMFAREREGPLMCLLCARASLAHIPTIFLFSLWEGFLFF